MKKDYRYSARVAFVREPYRLWCLRGGAKTTRREPGSLRLMEG